MIGKSKSAPKSAEKSEKKTRKKKEKGAPKKPMCAFFWYQKDAITKVD